MFQDINKAVKGEISAGLAFEELNAVYQSDRTFTSSAFARTASYCAKRMKTFGLSGAKVDRFPADGKTRSGAWVMPYAWDANDAVLTIEEPVELKGTVIARYAEIPCSLAMWSAPTPRGGTVADLVWVGDGQGLSSRRAGALKGKVAFTSANSAHVKGQIARLGGAGLVSCFVPQSLDKPDAVFWTNAWSDNPSGWGFINGDTKMFGFNISPRKGAWLQGLLETHGGLRVKAEVDTKIYAGEMFTASACIPGETRREEVLILGHAFEQGANDNASGCAVMLEAARALSRLIADGRLPRPRRSIRFLMVSECYTTFAYCERYNERMANTVAALCCDSVGHKQDACRSALGLSRPPDANASFATAFSERLAHEVWDGFRPEFKWLPRSYMTTDNVVTDPLIGPPTMLLSTYRSDFNWHSTTDTIDKIDVEGLGKVAEFAATYLYTIASAASVDALYFAALATARAKAEISQKMATTLEECSKGEVDFATARGRLLYIAERGISEVESVRSLLGLKETKTIEGELSSMSGEIIGDARQDVEQLERVMRQCGKLVNRRAPRKKAAAVKASRVVPVRKYIGTMALDLVPRKKRGNRVDPRWDNELTLAMFWCDGKRTLEEVLTLTGDELEKPVWGLVPVFEFLAKQGLIELRRA